MAAGAPFEIGLVMAGAISAGAYTAGVVDFLFQALDAWYEARQAGVPEAPPHEVQIKVLSGASAGGMTAALLAAIVGHDMEPVVQVPPLQPARNKLYDAWVEQVDISRLLQDHDLSAPDSHVVSLLDGTVLDQIADRAFQPDSTSKQRPYLADPLHVLLSVTNLRGVPYSIGFVGDWARAHELLLHADHLHFTIGRGDGADLDPQDLSQPGWQNLKQAALATGAFPVGLPPRLLQRLPADYAGYKWQVPLSPDAEAAYGQRCVQEVSVPPHWPEQFAMQQEPAYRFLCVDGGLMDNEPLELARRVLAGADGRNPRRGDQAHRAVLMIDPFPDTNVFDLAYKPDDSLLSVIGQMFSSLRYQAGFKPEELALAYADDVFSRFLIAPSRPPTVNQRPLACGSLGAFGGFICRRFREHDFQLGRRNCQRFLQRHFCLPPENPLFAGWSPELRARYANPEGELPIIPLVSPTVASEVERLPWPTMTAGELAELERQLRHRADVLLGHLLPQELVLSVLARVVWSLGMRRKVLGKLMSFIRADLERSHQLA